MWSWVLHRITGVAIFFFLLVHILDTALVYGARLQNFMREQKGNSTTLARFP